MAWTKILYQKTDNIVKITMNRPEMRNAQDYLMLEEMEQAFKEADLDEEVRVIILAGAGKSFSAGHDIGGKGTPAKGVPMQTKLQGLEGRLKREEYIYYKQGLAIRNVSKPTIAQVHGHCIAGGLLTACMCDLIVASEDASFSNPVLRMTPAAVELLIEPWEIGPRKAKELLWTGDPIDAKEAWRLGLVNRVVPKEKLEEATMKLARRIALTPPIAVSLTKRSINHMLDLMGQANSWEYHFLIHQMSHSTQESTGFNEQIRKAAMEEGGLSAFLAKRDQAYRLTE